MEKEVWKNILSSIKDIIMIDTYEISNLGNVRNIKTDKIILTNSIRSGYKSFTVHVKNKTYAYKVHRLVAQAFIPNDDPKKKFVNHIDGNKLNNKVTNLEWVTPSENVQHAIDTKLIKVTERRVIKLDPKTGKEIETYKSAKIAGEENGLADNTGIVKCCKGVNKTSGGFGWKYADENKNEQTDVDLKDYKQIKEFPKYYISKEGKVYSQPYKKFLKFQDNNDGYPHVQLTHNGTKRDYLVHRLVAELFVDNPKPDVKDQVNHIDGNRKNFHYNNLEWVTNSENNKHKHTILKKVKTES